MESWINRKSFQNLLLKVFFEVFFVEIFFSKNFFLKEKPSIEMFILKNIINKKTIFKFLKINFKFFQKP